MSLNTTPFRETFEGGLRRIEYLDEREDISMEISEFLRDFFWKAAKAYNTNLSKVYESAARVSIERFPEADPLPSTLTELYKITRIKPWNIAQLFEYLWVDLGVWINPKLQVANINITLSELTPILKEIIEFLWSRWIPRTWKIIAKKLNYSGFNILFPIEQDTMHKILGCRPNVTEILHHLWILETWEDRENLDNSLIIATKTQEAVAEDLDLEAPKWKKLLIQYLAKKEIILKPEDILDIKYGFVRYSQSGKEKQNKSSRKFPSEIDDFLGDELGDQIFASYKNSPN